jgi:hypothetical protein
MMSIAALSYRSRIVCSSAVCSRHSVGLKVKLPMKLEIDNRGTVDFIHNNSVGGRTIQVEVKQYFLHELKEAGLIICESCKGEDMSSDIFTKNYSQKWH